jgi:serine/threonine-protein kinase
MNDPAHPPRGLVAGKYEVVGLIGRGGMGSVYEGRHTSLGTRVAIKFVDPEYADSQEACARFITEARAAATIQSRHAIQIYDHGVSGDGRPYIVMELLVGEPLDRRLDRVGRLPLGETARILVQVCRALQRAHDAGIIHRDLKPENIFLVRGPDDDEEIAKVLDFGIAKFKAPPGGSGMTSSTKTGAVLGTPYYMSPEQARGLRNIDHRTDLWSLGIIAYKCVAGALPFDGESVGDLLVKICTAPPPVPSAAVPGLPHAFDNWFARALERDPERRFSSAIELADTLALAAGLSRRGYSGSREGVAVPAPLTGPAAGRSSGLEATAVPTATVTSSPFTASATPSKSSRGALLGLVAAGVLGLAVGVFAVFRLVTAFRAPSVLTETAISVSPGSVPPRVAPLAAQTGGLAGPMVPPLVVGSEEPKKAPVEALPRSPPSAIPGAPQATPVANTPPAGRSAPSPPHPSAPTPTTSAVSAVSARSVAPGLPSVLPAPPPLSPIPPPAKPPQADPGY